MISYQTYLHIDNLLAFTLDTTLPLNKYVDFLFLAQIESEGST